MPAVLHASAVQCGLPFLVSQHHASARECGAVWAECSEAAGVRVCLVGRCEVSETFVRVWRATRSLTEPCRTSRSCQRVRKGCPFRRRWGVKMRIRLFGGKEIKRQSGMPWSLVLCYNVLCTVTSITPLFLFGGDQVCLLVVHGISSFSFSLRLSLDSSFDGVVFEETLRICTGFSFSRLHMVDALKRGLGRGLSSSPAPFGFTFGLLNGQAHLG